jgi:TetR/AcrR family transcriptional regulator, cholesterol catabolism regulator
MMSITLETTASETRLREIYDTAAKLFHAQGYARTSMSDVARAMNLTKAGLYHHIASKELLLFGVINYGLDLLEEQVIRSVRAVREPVDRLRCLIRAHIQLILQSRFREITVILHENRTLKGNMRIQVDARKKRYILMLEDILGDLQRRRPHAGVSPHVGAFALLGMINWIYQWYRPSGTVSPEELADQFTRLFLNGYLGVEPKRGRPHTHRRTSK